MEIFTFYGHWRQTQELQAMFVQFAVLLVKEVLSCFGKLGGRDKTDGRLSNTKKCVTKNWRGTLGDDLKTCVYNVYGNVRYHHQKKLGERYMGILCTIPETFCESPYFIIEGSNNLKHLKRRVYICSYNHIPIYTNFTTDLTTDL